LNDRRSFLGQVVAAFDEKTDRVGAQLPNVAAAVFSCAVGLIVFMLFGGKYMIDTASTTWLMHQDPSQHYMGWAFFRHTPLLQFPLGANPLFGEKIASSIVFSDSIPLFALPLKLANSVLPHPFQYFGIWIAFCLCMHVFFSARILRQLGMPIEVVCLGAVLFVLSPVLLWRLHGHESLLGQWLLLAGVSLCLDEKRRDGMWLLLLVTAVLVHAYLLVMVAGIWFADFVGRWLRWHGDGRPSIALAFLPIVVCPLIMWATGYFMAPSMIGVRARDAGFGFYRSELQTFFDSDGMWSRILPDLPDGVGGDEGFAFLGLGGCALLLLAVVVCIRRRGVPGPSMQYRALFWIGVTFALFALSNRVAIVNETFISIPLPRFLDPFLVSFRASGRFIWLPTYLLLLTLVVFAVRWAGRRAGAMILAATVALQVFDLQPAMAFFHEKLSKPWQNPAQSAFWSEALEKYDRIALAPANSFTPTYLPMAMLAAEQGVAINAAYLARHDNRKLAAEEAEVLAAVEAGKFDPETLYVFSDDSLFQKAVATKPASAIAGKVDGFSILAPQWDGCTDACGLATTSNP
jgi:hypothetical protein